MRPITQAQALALSLAAQGLTAKQIGKRLNLSDATVKCHWQRAAIRLGANNTTHAVALAIASGQISAADLEAA